MSTSNAPRWGDSASEDEDDNIPRASSFAKFDQIDSQSKCLNNKASSSYTGHTSNDSNNTASRNSYNAPKKHHEKRGGKSKGGSGGSRSVSSVSSVGKSNNRGNASWKETAKSSQKYGSSDKVDGSAWMAQRAAKIKEREKDNRRQQEEQLKKMEKEQREKRKNQFGALKESLLLRKQDKHDNEETHVSPLAKLEEKVQNSPQRKNRPKLKLMPRTKPTPDILKENDQGVNDDNTSSQSQEANRKVDKILKRPKKKGKPKHTKKEGASKNPPQDLKDEDADDEQSLVSADTRSTSGSPPYQNGTKKQSRKQRKEPNKNRENKMSSLQNRKAKNGQNEKLPGDKSDGSFVPVGRTKKIDLPDGEIEYHVSLGSSNSKQNRREEFKNDTKHKNSSNGRKSEKNQFNNSKNNAGSRSKNDERKGVKSKAVNKHKNQRERTKSQGSEDNSKSGNSNAIKKSHEVEGTIQKDQNKAQDNSKGNNKNNQDKKSRTKNSGGKKKDNLNSNADKKSEHNSRKGAVNCKVEIG